MDDYNKERIEELKIEENNLGKRIHIIDKLRSCCKICTGCCLGYSLVRTSPRWFGFSLIPIGMDFYLSSRREKSRINFCDTKDEISQALEPEKWLEYERDNYESSKYFYR